MTPPATTRSPERLGSIAELRRRTQVLAVLDLLLRETPEHRFGRVRGLELAGRDNGQGDDVLIVFTDSGALIRGFDHESPMSPYDPEVALAGLSDDELEELSDEEEAELLGRLRPFPGVLEPLSDDLRTLLERLNREPARLVAIPSVLTFCLWRGVADEAWQVGEIDYPEGEDPDGSGFLLEPYACDASSYHAHLEHDLGRVVPLELVEAVFAHAPLSAELVALAQSPRSYEELESAARELGYGAGAR